MTVYQHWWSPDTLFRLDLETLVENERPAAAHHHHAAAAREQTELRVIFYGCGSSNNKPFGDGTKSKVGWHG